jgi:putative flavoprotein involved in K+ transport
MSIITVNGPIPGSELGYTLHHEHVFITVVDGLYFVGVHYLRKRKSSLLYGVGEDAAIVAQAIAARVGGAARHRASPSSGRN